MKEVRQFFFLTRRRQRGERCFFKSFAMQDETFVTRIRQAKSAEKAVEEGRRSMKADKPSVCHIQAAKLKIGMFRYKRQYE